MRSYDDADEAERLLEVNTTGWENTSRSWLRPMRYDVPTTPQQYQLFRVFEGRSPKLYPAWLIDEVVPA